MHEKVTQLNSTRSQIRQQLQDGVIRGGGVTTLWQVQATSGYAHKQKHKPHLSSHYRGVGQEYWQSLSQLPSASRVGSDKIKANE